MKLMLVLTGLLFTQAHGKSSASFQMDVVEPTIYGQRQLQQGCRVDSCDNKANGELCVVASTASATATTNACKVGCCVNKDCVIPTGTNPDPTAVCRIPCLEAGAPACGLRNTTCATFSCSSDVGYHVDLGPYNDGCVATLNDASCLPSDTNTNDCQVPKCSPVQNFTCVDFNKPQGSNCGATGKDCCLFNGVCETDENVCQYARPCNNFTFPFPPNVTYTAGNLDTDYSTTALNSATDPIKLTFATNSPPNAKFAAIIYDDDNCNGNILGVAGKPHYAIQYRPDGYMTGQHDGILNSTITSTNPASLVLNIPAFPKTFYSPHYNQDFPCLDDENKPYARCGKLQFCVEFQILDDCGRKADFVDVSIEIMFDLIEKCEDDFCGEVILERSKVVEDSDKVDLGEITCFPCGPGLVSTNAFGNNLPSIKVGQGSAVDLCIDVVPNIEGVCIYEILSLQLAVTRPSNPTVTVSYPVLPQGLSLIAYSQSGRSNPDYQPLGSYYSQFPNINRNDATVQFLVPGEEFQELNPLNLNGDCDDPPCQAAARVTGKVLLGLGCYCQDTKPVNCAVPATRNRRGLQEADQLDEVELQVPMEVFVEGKTAEPIASFNIFSWFTSLLGWLVRLLTFGLVGW